MSEVKKTGAPKKKPATKKKAQAKKKVVEVISYGIKMVIPTVEYGNIQPEIIVNANSLEEAHDFIVPHMNKLWKEYYLVDGKRPVPATPPPAPVTPPVVPAVVEPTPVAMPPAVPAPAPIPISAVEVTPAPVTPVATVTPPAPIPVPVVPAPVAVAPAPVAVAPAPPASSVALVKATQAIESCMSLEAFELIAKQVEISTKLTTEDKNDLVVLLTAKHAQLTTK